MTFQTEPEVVCIPKIEQKMIVDLLVFVNFVHVKELQATECMKAIEKELMLLAIVGLTVASTCAS